MPALLPAGQDDVHVGAPTAGRVRVNGRDALFSQLTDREEAVVLAYESGLITQGSS